MNKLRKWIIKKMIGTNSVVFISNCTISVPRDIQIEVSGYVKGHISSNIFLTSTNHIIKVSIGRDK